MAALEVDGYPVLLDDADLLLLAGWQLKIVAPDGTPRVIAVRGPERAWLSRLLLTPPQHLVVDHINGNPLDNRRANLRIISQGDNARNTARRKDSRQPYKGITRHRRRWRARISAGGREIHLGLFATAEAAACAYDAAARLLSPYARVNFGEDECLQHEYAAVVEGRNRLRTALSRLPVGSAPIPTPSLAR